MLKKKIQGSRGVGEGGQQEWEGGEKIACKMVYSQQFPAKHPVSGGEWLTSLLHFLSAL